MCRTAKDGRHLANLVFDAAALCKAAQDRLIQRTGPGRPDTFEQWQIAALIFIAMLRGRKSKSSQWRFLHEHAQLLLKELRPSLKLDALPSRATYMRRHPLAHTLFEEAIMLGGRKALIHHVGDASVVSVDKSMIAARGGVRPNRSNQPRPRGVDMEAGWGKSIHDGWVWGYSYEVVVCAGKHGQIVPLLASASTANTSEHRSFRGKIPRLPRSTRYTLGDKGYDGNELAEAIEYNKRGIRTHRRFITPFMPRGGNPSAVGRLKRKGRRERLRQHRILREKFFHSPKGHRLYRRRFRTAEPFNQWLKERFELELHVWHRGLKNNQTMLLTAIFIYQSLQRYNFARGHRNGSVQWILDAL